MAKYYLVENRQFVLLGPIDWKHRFIQSELDDLEVSYTVSPTESGYVNIDGTYEIFPQGSSFIPDYDPTFEELVGPVITYENNEAHESFTKRDKDITSIKNTLNTLVAAKRYEQEIKGIEYTLDENNILLPTDRVGKQQFIDLLQTIGESNINYKFKDVFYTLDKTKVANIVSAISTYVQSQFDWEYNKHIAIQNANTIDELKAISIKSNQ